MPAPRDVVGLELLSKTGVRLVCDGDGWRLINQRSLGHQELEAARALLARAEDFAEKTRLDPKEDESLALLRRGEHVAKRLDLRITHKEFRERERR
jgi:hypothetical protein